MDDAGTGPYDEALADGEELRARPRTAATLRAICTKRIQAGRVLAKVMATARRTMAATSSEAAVNPKTQTRVASAASCTGSPACRKAPS